MPTPAETILAKTVLPTALDTAEFRARWGTRIHEQALMSARTTQEAYLLHLQRVLAEVADGKINDARARELLIDELRSLGYDSEAGGFPGDEGIPPATAGSLTDLASRMRLNLIIKTNQQTAQSLGQIARSEDPVIAEMYPAYELRSGSYRRQHRQDWPARWRAAGEATGWDGALRDRMWALKSSPIWQALGDGAGGYRDTLGNPYPPFAWGSSYVWRDRHRREAAAAGLIKEEARA